MRRHLGILVHLGEQQLPSPLSCSLMTVVKVFSPVDGKSWCWKIVVIISLLFVVLGLWIRVSILDRATANLRHVMTKKR